MFQNIALFNLFSSKARDKSSVSQETDLTFVCDVADDLKEEVEKEVVEEKKIEEEELSEEKEEDMGDKTEEETEKEMEEEASIQDQLNITESSGERYDVDEATHTDQETKKPNNWISVAFKGFHSFCSLKH